ncbi:retrovirus-related Pol polyprotein from transposon 297 [Trichonephila clavata]|uniref:Retrovirus-related Pol polyprotein from transposon 297 n=1 Tax=Trichonephila clavata TaxID=2740835 RepID=A0A8X6K9P4_TRICU|nr:retrovirus-related Pol polyprotein from transposon 297 [Trichonephila clavata]
MDDGSEKELHFNKLRPYIARIEQIGLIFDQDDEFGELHYAPIDTVELDVNDIYNHVIDSSSGLENSQKISLRTSSLNSQTYLALFQALLSAPHSAQIQVISDHDPLTYLTNSAPHSAKLTRWALALQRYNVKVSYRRGSAHGNADALSRLRISE